MPSLSPRFVLALLLGASAVASCGPDPYAGMPRSSGEIRARVRPGGTYIRTEGESTGVLRLSGCPATEHDAVGQAHAQHGHATIARNAVGDELELAPNAVPEGTTVTIERKGNYEYRTVKAEAHHKYPAARLTIDLTGCTPSTHYTVILRYQGQWIDVGGQVHGSAITVDLEHLSIYAVAGT
jgi:hypothetical protein